MSSSPPNKIPFKCVVCSGFGTLKSGSLTCHACDGKGYVVVDQEIDIDIKIGEKDENKDSVPQTMV